MNEEYRYWMVHRGDNGMYPSRQVHAHKAEAIVEAQRLSAENPGVVFYVLVTVGYAKSVQPARYFEFDPELPF